MSEWKLKDCCLSISDGDHLPPPKTDSGIPFITISNIDSTNHIDFGNTLFVPIEYYEKLDDIRKAQPNDIIYSVVGSFGKPVLIKDDRKFVFQRHIAILRPNSEIVDSRFLYYVMLSRDFYMQADTVAIGAAQRTISLSSLRNMKVELPSLPIQHRIATILSRYDTLIENYQKQIKLLEEAAQRLYKEWFVELRFPGHENTKMVDGLPEGWERKKVGDLLEKIQRTKQVPANNYQLTGNIPIIDQSKDYIAGYTDDEECLVKVSVPFIVFGDHTRVLKFIPFSFAKGADGTQLIMSNDLDKMPQTLFYNSLVNVDLSNYSYARHFKYLKEELVVVPTKEIASSYDEVVSRDYQTIHNNRKQIRLLTEARDRLLPRLMGGGMEVDAPKGQRAINPVHRSGYNPQTNHAPKGQKN